MNAKILKYELFLLFSLTLITLVVFYYRDALPDNYLSISSTSSYGFFVYYGTSLFNFINYYSGPWIMIPCVSFTLLYVFIFSKRADWIDALNLLSIGIFSLWTAYYLWPSLLGAGLFQILTSDFSPFASLSLWGFSLIGLAWGTFRGGFTEKVKLLSTEIKKVDLVRPSEKVFDLAMVYFNHFRQKFFPKSEHKEIEHNESEQITGVIEAEQSDEACGETLGIVQITLDQDLEGTCITARKVIQDNGEIYREDLAIVIENDLEIVESGNEPTFNKILKSREEFNENKYYDLVKLAANYKKSEQKFTQPEEKYFHDIITKIQVKLGEFKIQGRIINVLKGPVVDTFEWELGAGEKVSRLTVTAEDLSLALSGSPIRMVYPMKGRTTVGIEVPRNPREFIFLDDVITSKDFINTVHQLPLAMGKDAFGGPIVVDLAAMPHMLVAGSTGAGKSVFINSILVSLLIKKSPKQMKLILIDPKQLELALYARLPHLLMPVITEAKTAATSLLWACQEMERRYSIMSEFGVRNIEGFNHKLKRAPREIVDKIRKFYEYSMEDTYELPYIVIIVDEFADLILTQKGKEIETHICRLAAKARAAGVHLILATQRPSVDVITGLIKSNFPTRVSFRVTSSTDSRTILNAMGAEKLLGKGDMLYKQGVDTTRIHSAYVEEEEIESLTEKLAEMAPTFNPNIMEFLENGGEEESELTTSMRENGDVAERDDKYDEAVRVVVEHRSASASLLQRRLGVGYNRAANLIEEMEVKGVVGPAQGSKPRKVLMGSESLI
jgi:S-DNA-T family DNA segregation ATPase FtsK/SpoIIIE